MRITALETIQLAEFPNLCFVRLHTNAGLVGLGETFFGAHEVAAYLHETAAPRLLGKDPSAIDGLRIAIQQYVGTRSTGVEARGDSAVDIALWDLAGKTAGLPVDLQLLGGRTPRRSASTTPARATGTCRRRSAPTSTTGGFRRPSGGTAPTRTSTPSSTGARERAPRRACSRRA